VVELYCEVTTGYSPNLAVAVDLAAAATYAVLEAAAVADDPVHARPRPQVLDPRRRTVIKSFNL
jgi:hypothetical protein